MSKKSLYTHCYLFVYSLPAVTVRSLPLKLLNWFDTTGDIVRKFNTQASLTKYQKLHDLFFLFRAYK